MAARDWPGAVAAFTALAGQRPADASAWIALAQAQVRAGRHRDGCVATLRAQAAGVSTFADGVPLARLLERYHEVQALATLSAALRAHAGEASADALVALADVLGREDLHADALHWLDRAAALDPAHAPAAYLRGSTRLFMGDFAGARADLERAIALAPHFAHAHWRLTALRTRDPAGAVARVERLRRERDRVAAGGEHDIHFSYALFDELHDLREHTAAWDALARANRAKRALLRYDPEADLRLMQAIRTRCDAAFVRGPGAASEGPRPVFVAGLFRSGTTLLERLLAGHPEVAAGGETMDFPARLRLAVDHRGRGVLDAEVLGRSATVDWAALGRDYLAGSAWRAAGGRAWTEKLPSNLLLLGLVARAVPGARFVHMRRAPMDVCFANLRMLYGGFGRYSYDQRELAAYHHGYAALMAHWRGVLGPRLLEVSLA
ncbi:MAG TPA: sulfotransferase, partial [Luteimonas sp.]|nr:sulfotransferase [Luteimonas sp.]